MAWLVHSRTRCRPLHTTLPLHYYMYDPFGVTCGWFICIAIAAMISRYYWLPTKQTTRKTQHNTTQCITMWSGESRVSTGNNTFEYRWMDNWHAFFNIAHICASNAICSVSNAWPSISPNNPWHHDDDDDDDHDGVDSVELVDEEGNGALLSPLVLLLDDALDNDISCMTRATKCCINAYRIYGENYEVDWIMRWWCYCIIRTRGIIVPVCILWNHFISWTITRVTTGSYRNNAFIDLKG